MIIDSKRIPQESRDKAADILRREEQRELLGLDTVDERSFIIELNNEIPYSEEIEFEYDNTPEKPKKKTSGSMVRYTRNKSVANNALSLAKHRCEANESHYLFRRKNSNTFYTEPHHLVPLSASNDISECNLDREQNIVSLCSNCHNLLHYGADVESVLGPLFEKREWLLHLIGIHITFEKLLEYYK